jgi:3'(2'),5'-bisphosphate nucleotidase
MLQLAQIAVDAGELILEIARKGCAPSLKADSSPVTESDRAAEALIVARLSSLLPGTPVVAEERTAEGCRPETGQRFILVDPLDGTREFIAGRCEFTVNLALVQSGRPVVGAIYAPALGRLWLSGREAFAADVRPGTAVQPDQLRRISVRRPDASGLVALVSRSHLDPDTESYLRRLPVRETRPMGSSLKFCLIAEGEADLYPRLGPTNEWDIAAGHAILAAAGGEVTSPDGTPLVYGNAAENFHLNGFIACGWQHPSVEGSAVTVQSELPGSSSGSRRPGPTRRGAST